MTEAPRSEPAKILIVDDQPSVRHFVSRILNHAGYTTSTASDGPEALKIVEASGAINLLVTDLIMPQMRGDELARRVREADPGVKVLYVTGHRDELFQGTTTLGEAEAFLDKPFAMHDLLEAVSMLLVGQLDRSAPEPGASGASRHATRRTVRVLIVEEVDADALQIQRELERTRFEVECERVETRAALTTALEGQTWDLIVTDRTMPRLNAMEMLRIVRERGLSVPCVLVSRTASKKTAAFAMRMGFDDFVSKDNLAALGASVARALDDAETRTARSSLSRVRLQNGQEFNVLEWAPDAAVLTGLVGLAPGGDHDCLLLAGGDATQVRIHVVRSEVAAVTAAKIMYQTVVTVLGG
jgi:DNA-binding NtrC family response regulator